MSQPACPNKRTECLLKPLLDSNISSRQADLPALLYKKAQKIVLIASACRASYLVALSRPYLELN